MARGGRSVFDFAEPAVAQQGAQERGFAGIGVPDDGEGKGLDSRGIYRWNALRLCRGGPDGPRKGVGEAG